MHPRSLFLKTILLLSLFLSLGCSKQGFKSLKYQNTDLSSVDDPPPTPELGAEYGTADMTGNIQAYQDLQFRFKIPSGVTGATYVANGLPAWLTLDAANNELSGVPPAPGVSAEFTISVNGENKGPYKVTVVGDPIKVHQWHLKNTGQTAFALSGGRSGEDIHLEQTIRERILGKDIRIAVSDTGVLETHRGLRGNILPNASRNYLNNFAQVLTWNGTSTPDVNDAGNAHGTGVAGLIAEQGWLGIGARGVAPLAKIAGFLFIQAQEQLVAAGLLTVAYLDQYRGDFDIFNYSWGDAQCALTEYPDSLRDRLKLSAETLRGGKGAVMIKAAGNEFVASLDDCYLNQPPTAFYLGNSNFSEDSASPHIITVAAVSAEGVSSSYSSPGANIWIAAPGGEYGWTVSPNNQAIHLEPAMVTTDFVGANRGLKTFSQTRNSFDTGAAPNAEFEHMATFNGTSSASPVVAGAVALLLSTNPNLTYRDVKHILATTADKIEPAAAATPHPQAASNLAGHTYEQGWITNAGGMNFHNWYGFGRVHVDRAVAMAKNYVSPLGVQKETNTGATWKYDSGNLNNLAVPPASATGVTNALTVTENYKVEAIQVRLSAAQCIGALGVELTSPSGTKSILMNINSMILDAEIESHIFVSNAFYNENSVGAWTLKLIGGRANCTTQWRNWQLNVIGH